jgi:hypothetical protein
MPVGPLEDFLRNPRAQSASPADSRDESGDCFGRRLLLEQAVSSLVPKVGKVAHRFCVNQGEEPSNRKIRDFFTRFGFPIW